LGILAAGVSASFWPFGKKSVAPLTENVLQPSVQVALPSVAPSQEDANLTFVLPDGQTLAGLLDTAFVTPAAFRGSEESDMVRQVLLLPVAAAPEVKMAKPADSVAHVFKRRQKLSEEELKRDLRWAKEIPPMTTATTSRVMNSHMERFRSFGDIDFEPRVLLEARPDLRMLPIRHGSPIKSDPKTAGELEAFSRRLHFLVDHTVPRKEDGEHVKPERLREWMSKEKTPGRRPAWVRAEAVPALRQILMGEDKPLRWLLVELLAENPSPAASAALAQRAVFELSPDLRQRAVEAVQGRPHRDFHHILLNAMRYPWAPAADHAAEALVALNDQGAVATLITDLKKPDPNQPYQTGQHTIMREVVRINHQSNCLMCHSPAVSGWRDPVAKEVPGVFLSGTIEANGGGYHATQLPRVATSPLLIRADIVFMRQDFSLSLAVNQNGTAPGGDQRFDFLIRTRPIKPQEMSEFKTVGTRSSYPQREAALWALRELTGKDAGNQMDDWVRLFPNAEVDVQAAKLSAQLLQARGVKQAQMLAKFKDHEGDAYTQALALAIPQMKIKSQDQVRKALEERLSRLAPDMLRDRLRDGDAEIRRAAAKACALLALDDLVPDLLDLLEDPNPTVVEAAQSALRRLTGSDAAASG
jgi:HEAT repeat protein